MFWGCRGIKINRKNVIKYMRQRTRLEYIMTILKAAKCFEKIGRIMEKNGGGIAYREKCITNNKFYYQKNDKKTTSHR